MVKWVWILPDNPVVMGSNLGQCSKFDNIYLRHIKLIDRPTNRRKEGRKEGRKDGHRVTAVSPSHYVDGLTGA